MQDKQAFDAIEAIMDAAGISPDDMLDHFVEQQEQDPQPKQPEVLREPVEILRDGLILAKEVTGLENQQIGEMINDVTGGAVTHWINGRTNPSRANRVALYRWLRSVENAMNVDLLPDSLLLDDQGENVKRH